MAVQYVNAGRVHRVVHYGAAMKLRLATFVLACCALLASINGASGLKITQQVRSSSFKSSAIAAMADNSGKDALKKEFEKHVLVPRSAFQEGDQEFDSTGKPLKTPAKNRWLAYGPILITKVNPHSHSLLLEGVRVDSPSLVKPDKKHLLGSGHTIKVEIHLDHPVSSSDEVRDILNRVFFLDVKASPFSLPEYRRPEEKIGTNETIYHVGNGVSPPVPIYQPDPGYSDSARNEKYQGTLALGIVVDKTGQVSRIKIAKPLGMGLDEKAVERVGIWKFKPARHNGEPVAVEVSVEVTFNLY